MSEFKILSDSEHILRRPQMYVGSTTEETQTIYIDGNDVQVNVVPGLLKIINEIIDNSVDAYIRNPSKKHEICVGIEKDFATEDMLVTITDNGTGIPIVMHDGFLQPELCWFRAKSGTSFSDDRSSIGTNGVGSFCTSVFSKTFVGVSNWSGKQFTVGGSHGEVNFRDDSKTSSRTGCEIRFSPDLSYFNEGDINFDDHELSIKQRLHNLAVCFPEIKFKFNGVIIKFKNSNDLRKIYGDDSIVIEHPNKIFLLKSSPDNPKINCYLNGLHLKQGGTHIDCLMHKIIEELRPMIKRKWKIEIQPSNIKNNLFIGSWFSGYNNMKFDSQTKERLTNTWGESGEYLECFDAKKIAKQIIDNEAIIMPVVQGILYKKELADRLALARAQKGTKKAKIIGHIQANSRDVEERILMLAEGQSAIGMLLSVRDANKIGGYALRGKVLNTRGKTPNEIIKNKELMEIMSILGLEFGKPAVSNYGKIGIMSDADPDGDAIACMLVNFFSLWPELFEQRRICRVETPLFICNKGKLMKWFYSKEEMESAKLGSGWTVKYNKGLGSLSKEVYREMINNPKLTTITLDEVEDLESLEMAFGDSPDKRKEWLLND